VTAGVPVTYYTRIAWQLFFFLRTDGYYVISTLFDCRSLLSHTEDYLWYLSAQVRRAGRPVDQSAIPVREMRVIRQYPIVWILGRIVSLSAFAFVGVPALRAAERAAALTDTADAV
jgi:putative peptide zinc metalloprotease protein